jgi:hypothetical protein
MITTPVQRMDVIAKQDVLLLKYLVTIMISVLMTTVVQKLDVIMKHMTAMTIMHVLKILVILV